MRYVGDLFVEEPDQWGLRGDEYLWQELRKTLATVQLPSSTTKLERLLENAFWDATGTTLVFCNEVWLERFAHGGMSSGIVRGDFWRSRGFPLVLRQFSAACLTSRG